ncbi:MAG: protein phosphatase 2C domain-containing protein [Bacteroidota bacterium]
MKIYLHPAQGFHEVGQRKNNEDFVYPALTGRESDEPGQLFLVCDGVGGAARGEEASRIACETLGQYLTGFEYVGADEVQAGLQRVEAQFDDYLASHPGAKGMGTTLTLLAFHERGATIAHIGDSRVYHLRDGAVLFRTADHSFVNELVRKRIITEAEARTHPKRNIVTRAIVGSHQAARADLTLREDVRAGDYFLLCTDGVWETLNDASLLEILSDATLGNREKMRKIARLCKRSAKDNYSAYLLSVAMVEGGSSPVWVEDKGESRSWNLTWPLLALGGLLLFNAAMYFYRPAAEEGSEAAVTVEESVGAELPRETVVNAIELDLSSVADTIRFEERVDSSRLDSLRGGTEEFEGEPNGETKLKIRPTNANELTPTKD